MLLFLTLNLHVDSVPLTVLLLGKHLTVTHILTCLAFMTPPGLPNHIKALYTIGIILTSLIEKHFQLTGQTSQKFNSGICSILNAFELIN